MKKLPFAMLVLAGAFLSAAPALADTVNYSLTTVNPTVAPGGTVTFNGLIEAPLSNLNNISIVQDSFSCTGCTINDDAFLNGTPFELVPGESFAGPLFSVTALGTDTAGSYLGSFDISFADSLGNPINDSVPFTITVGSPASVTPEPGSWLLLTTGLAGVGILRRRMSGAVANL